MAQRSFLYVDVATEIRSRVVKGTIAPGSRLPSLSEFVDQFGVSAITIRRALGELMHEGLIEGHQGLGVFVKAVPRIHRVLAGDPNRTIGDEIARAGFKPRLAEIGASQIKATEEIASRLKVTAGSNIFSTCAPKWPTPCGKSSAISLSSSFWKTKSWPSLT
jgi:DNA-binding GntR family transcriptional regulator